MSRRAMIAPSFLWRGIFWIERFLPTPAPVVDDGLASATRRRKAMLVLLVFPLMLLIRQRQETFSLVIRSRVAFEQLSLVVAGCVALAAVCFGMKAWHDARKTARDGTTGQ